MIRNLTIISILTVLFLIVSCNGKAPKSKTGEEKKTDVAKSAHSDNENKVTPTKKPGGKNLRKKYSSQIKESKKIRKEFLSTLKKRLITAIKTNGPVAALSTCKTASPEVESSFQKKNPDILSIRRISLKPRNSKTHTPSPDERKKLEQMEKRVQANKKPGLGVISAKDSVTILFPIRTGKACLLCHGDSASLDPKLKAELNKLYPDDQATGYKVKDLRGALAIKWKAN